MNYQEIIVLASALLVGAAAYWAGYRDGSLKVLVKWQQFLEDLVERKEGENGND